MFKEADNCSIFHEKVNNETTYIYNSKQNFTLPLIIIQYIALYLDFKLTFGSQSVNHNVVNYFITYSKNHNYIGNLALTMFALTLILEKEQFVLW